MAELKTLVIAQDPAYVAPLAKQIIWTNTLGVPVYVRQFEITHLMDFNVDGDMQTTLQWSNGTVGRIIAVFPEDHYHGGHGRMDVSYYPDWVTVAPHEMVVVQYQTSWISVAGGHAGLLVLMRYTL